MGHVRPLCCLQWHSWGPRAAEVLQCPVRSLSRLHEPLVRGGLPGKSKTLQLWSFNLTSPWAGGSTGALGSSNPPPLKLCGLWNYLCPQLPSCFLAGQGCLYLYIISTETLKQEAFPCFSQHPVSNFSGSYGKKSPQRLTEFIWNSKTNEAFVSLLT